MDYQRFGHTPREESTISQKRNKLFSRQEYHEDQRLPPKVIHSGFPSTQGTQYVEGNDSCLAISRE